MDERIALQTGDIVKDCYHIVREIGRGGSCLVYEAYYIDDEGLNHSVRLKEFYPYALRLERNGYSILSDRNENRFLAEKQRFIEGYRNNVILQQKAGLINSSVDARKKIETNGTVYIEYSCDDGTTYDKAEPKSLVDCLKITKAVAQVIEKYHNLGYLHLDIKPENILILDETMELVVLFDFDSVIRMEEVHAGNLNKISYSVGYAAPELVQGNVKKIGPQTDIFGIGALLFAALFKRTPGHADKDLRAKYDFTVLSETNTSLNPKLYTLLTQFFHKTMSPSLAMRFGCIDQLIAALDEMLAVKDIYVVSNFVYNANSFVGRNKELTDIDTQMARDDIHAVFLSGIGGIGKTEIAKRYAYLNQKKYDTIVFLPFTGSLVETFASEELQIVNLQQEGNTAEENYRLKMDFLQKNFTEKDLIIVDNFDVELDDNLEEILSICRAKFIFTSREDFRELDYHQIDIKKMEDPNDTKKLFGIYNDMEYTDEEWNALNTLFSIIDSHTMLVTLLAKHLAKSDQDPCELLKIFQSVKGVISMESTRVRHRKDYKAQSDIVQNHLRTLFNINQFSNYEKELLMAISLLGSVRIREKLFLEIYDEPACKESLDSLVQRGWMEVSGDGKISLHQIIQDLIYNDFEPSTVNCKKFVQKMISFFKRTNREVSFQIGKEKLASLFIERVTGDNAVLAEVYYEYCRNIKYAPLLLNKAKEIAENDSDNERLLVLAKIENYQLRRLKISGDSDAFWEGIDKEQIDELYMRVIDITNRIFKYVQDYMASVYNISPNMDTVDGIGMFAKTLDLAEISYRLFIHRIERNIPYAGYLIDRSAEVLKDTAEALVYMANQICGDYFLTEDDEHCGLGVFYEDAEYIYRYLCETIETYPENTSFSFKEALYNKLIALYETDDYVEAFRVSCVGSTEKAAYYSAKLNDLRNNHDDTKDTVYFYTCDYEEAADRALYEMRYHDAIRLYLLAKQNDGYFMDSICYGLSDAYIAVECFDKAEEELRIILEHDKESGADLSVTYERLVNLYEAWGKIEQAQTCCDELLMHLEASEDQTMYGKGRKLKCQVKRHKLVGQELESLSMAEYESYVSDIEELINDSFLDSELVDTILAVLSVDNNISDRRRKLELILNAAIIYRNHYHEWEAELMFQKLICPDIRMGFLDIYMNAVLSAADMYINGFNDNYSLAEGLLCEAQSLQEHVDINVVYIREKIKKLIWELSERTFGEYGNLNEEEIGDCDYYLVTRYDLESGNSKLDISDAWSKAVEYYMKAANTDRIAACLYKMYESLPLEYTKISEYCSLFIKYLKLSQESNLPTSITTLSENIRKLLSAGQMNKTEQRDVWFSLGEQLLNNAYYSEALVVYTLGFKAQFEERKYLERMGNNRSSWLSDLDPHSVLQRIFPENLENDENKIIWEINTLLKGLGHLDQFKELCTFLDNTKSRYESFQIEYKHN